MSFRAMLNQTATIFRKVSPGEDEYNTPFPAQTVCVAEKIPCTYSRRSVTLSQETPKPIIAEGYRFFFLAHADIRPGDIAEVAGLGQYRLGIPYKPRNHHIEVDADAQSEA